MLEEEEGEAEDPEEDEVVEPAVPDCHPDQAPTLEMEFEDEMQVESYWRIEAAAAEAACKDDQPKEETCDDEDDEKNAKTENKEGEDEQISKIQAKSNKKTEKATRKKEEEKGNIEAKADKKTEKATKEKEKEKGNIEAKADKKTEKKGKTDQDGKGKQHELEEESNVPFVQDLVSDDDKKKDESRGTFKDWWAGIEGM